MKLKDYVTLGNLACGLASIVALMHDDFEWASYWILLGYVFDALDGVVARVTRQFNKFGSELDNLCDMVSCSIAPGFLVFYAFYHFAQYPLWAAFALMLLPTAVGTVRAARFNVRRAEFPGFFIGMPRTAYALIMVALLNSALFQVAGASLSGYLYLVPAALIVIVSWAMVSFYPFVGHHNRKFKGWLRFGLYFWLIATSVAWLIGWLVFDYPELVFDVLLFNQLCYLLLTWFVIPKEELKAYWKYVEEWKAMGE